MKSRIILFLVFSLLCFCDLTAQIKGYVLLKQDAQSKLYEKKGPEYISHIVLYPDQTFEFYFSSTGLSRKYSCGPITKGKVDTVTITSDRRYLKTHPKLSLYADKRRHEYRFVDFTSTKLVLRKRAADMISSLTIHLADPAAGIPVDSLISQQGPGPGK